MKNQGDSLSKYNGVKSGIRKIYNKSGMFLVLALLIIVLSLTAPNFLGARNLINIVRQISFIAIIAIGSLAVIITGGIDLSPGSVVAITSVIVASVAHPGEYPLVITILIGLSVGAVAGAINGLLITKAGLPPFIATLAMFTVAKGVALLLSNGRTVGNVKEDLIFLGTGSLLGIPIPIIVLLIVGIASWILLNNTRTGRHIYAVGGNANAAVISGISVFKVKLFVYAFAGVLASLSGILLTARVASGQPSLGSGFELDAIAATVIGGTSMTGGIGSVVGTIIGALIIGVINNGLELMNVNVYWQEIAKGVIIALAVFIDKKRNRPNK